MQKEEKINTEIDEYLINIIRRDNNNVVDFKKSYINKIFPSKDSTYLLKTGIITLLMICTLYTNVSAKGGDSGLKTEKEKSATELSISFSPAFPMSTDHRITALFGYRTGFGSRNHKGIDIGCQNGTPVYAIDGGTVEVRNEGAKKGYGLYVIITHPNGVQSLYAHGSKIPSNIKDGTVVSKGDLIMYSGSSGKSSGGHLHFEIIVDGTRVNPLPFYSADILSTVPLKTESIPKTQKDAYAEYVALRGQ
jgi:murein DD-endopeptidase MepM/ murein hydrolase activator NlpD